MRTDTLLIEIGTEELPPKALKTLGSSLGNFVEEGLREAQLSFDTISWYAAPRRLAVSATVCEYQQTDKIIEKRGPAIAAAFDANGEPTKAALGWAKGNGIDISQAQRLKTDKGEWLLHQAEVKGQTLADLIEGIVAAAIAKLPIPKPMRWGDSSTQFIRPVHTFTAMFGEEILPATILDLTSDNLIQGHRFHGDKQFALSHADNYLNAMREHYVIADFAERCEFIRQGIDAQANTLGLIADYEQSLLEEIASLVEFPVIMQASFENRFLDVPKEALIYTMKDDQKYVPLLDTSGSLSNQFLFVSNIQSSAPEHVIEGNEKVIRPRLADAEFFFNADKNTSLESRLPALESILFQKQLGTLAEKAQRLSLLSGFIAKRINADQVQASRAGLLCKTDLLTNMVMEFPDVQGYMGKYYALNDGEDDIVANAIESHYAPRQSGDPVPTSNVSAAVALAEKLDTLAGIFGIGMLPKGDKDPFALRRAAIGALRIIVENGYDLCIAELLEFASSLYEDKLTNPDSVSQSIAFVTSRFRPMYTDKGFNVDVILAVMANKITKPADFDSRVRAVTEFASLPEALSLASANKRVANILNKNVADINALPAVSPDLLVEAEEVALFEALSKYQISDKIAYSELLTSLAALQMPVDQFFDAVMVMADDEDTKQNRLALLAQLRALFLHTADISLLAQK